VLEGHAGRVLQLLFGENGRKLISSSADTTAMVWDLTGLRTTAALPAEKNLPSELREFWRVLGEANAAKAYQAIWRLTATPSPTVAFLRAHLHPVKPVDVKTLANLLADLDSPEYLVRQKAALELSKLDRLAEAALRKARTGQPVLELRRRIEQLLEQIEAVPFPDLLRAMRAVEALERVETAEARRLLNELANGAPEARLTQEAKSSLERLAKQPSSVLDQRP
jgi:hypothetical protein